MAPRKNSLNEYAIRGVVIVYGIILLTLILLAASNYPVQWRSEVNHERQRDLEVLAQSVQYYSLDHGQSVFAIPETPVMITNRDDCSFDCPALGTQLSCFNLQKILVPDYVAKIPSDPLLTSTTSSGFYFFRQGNATTFGACNYFFKDPILLTKDI